PITLPRAREVLEDAGATLGVEMSQFQPRFHMSLIGGALQPFFGPRQVLLVAVALEVGDAQFILGTHVSLPRRLAEPRQSFSQPLNRLALIFQYAELKLGLGISSCRCLLQFLP